MCEERRNSEFHVKRHAASTQRALICHGSKSLCLSFQATQMPQVTQPTHYRQSDIDKLHFLAWKSYDNDYNTGPVRDLTTFRIFVGLSICPQSNMSYILWQDNWVIYATLQKSWMAFDCGYKKFGMRRRLIIWLKVCVHA